MAGATLTLERASAEITFRAAPRPEAATVVRLGSFDGPLALLLALIEHRELDVLEVPLGELAAAYLDALAALPGDRLRNISAFVSIAAQLILIKSRALLPRPPEVSAAPSDDGPDPQEQLRERLVLYRTYRDASLRLAARSDSGSALFHREGVSALASANAGSRPARVSPLDPEVLGGALGRVIQLAVAPEPPPQIVRRSVSLSDRAALIREALALAPQLVLQDLLRGVTDRVVVAVTFLAMLELAKLRELVVEQDRPWGPIRCRRSRPAVTSGGSAEALEP